MGNKLVNMLLKLKRAKFCFSCLSLHPDDRRCLRLRLRPQTFRLTRQNQEKKNPQTNKKNKK